MSAREFRLEVLYKSISRKHETIEYLESKVEELHEQITEQEDLVGKICFSREDEETI